MSTVRSAAEYRYLPMARRSSSGSSAGTPVTGDKPIIYVNGQYVSRARRWSAQATTAALRRRRSRGFCVYNGKISAPATWTRLHARPRRSG